MSNVNLYEMGSKASARQVWSLAQYLMRHRPDQMIGLLQVYQGHLLPLLAWTTGFAYAMSLIEDNGYPLDIDEALHGYTEDVPFDFEGALRKYIESGGY